MQDSVEYLKNEVTSCNHERDLVDRLVATRQELKAAQLHSKRTAAAGHSQAAELFDWVSELPFGNKHVLRLSCKYLPTLFPAIGC